MLCIPAVLSRLPNSSQFSLCERVIPCRALAWFINQASSPRKSVALWRENSYHFFIALLFSSSFFFFSGKSLYLISPLCCEVVLVISRLDAHCFYSHLLVSSPRLLFVAASYLWWCCWCILAVQKACIMRENQPGCCCFEHRNKDTAGQRFCHPWAPQLFPYIYSPQERKIVK